MASGKHYPDWQNKIRAWKASGKTIKQWCQENQIPITTFYGWQKRLKKSSQESNKPFIELKDKFNANSGIILELHEFKIHLTADFNATLLRKCIAILKGGIC